ncbi:Pectic enzymes secretion protein outO [Kingella potus]|uniref:Prepilin leader peptidase/N-methyltransferase n=1 Tax=Kingella potus TaxID=265175 RepID=A0A377R0L3_9NEIS|nr:A24 family peptidase [Kingella potus]UOP00971.1 prepilin peptidase [Kingella potus]STR00629.1 Pectic enzymes secretion protein outO [Kingella potus]
MGDFYLRMAENYGSWVVHLSVIFGLLVGSFLNVVIYRLPVMMERGWTLFAKGHLGIEPTKEELQPFSLTKPASRCPKCGNMVKPWQNIPVISYLLLKGQCGHCHTPISIRYPAIEILTACMFGIVAVRYGWSWLTLTGLVFTAILIALTFIDADTQYLPDELTLSLIWLGLLANCNGNGLISLQQSVIGAVCGYMSLRLLNALHKAVRGIDGMGGGDWKLLAALGAWLGAAALPVVVLAAAIFGIVSALILRVRQKEPIAFGPCLAVAGWLIFIGYDKVSAGIRWWLRMSGFS